jgi:hypothetical protein
VLFHVGIRISNRVTIKVMIIKNKEKYFPTKHNMSEKMIMESKESVLSTFSKYLNATEDELKDFTILIEDEDIENWTCSFEELEDMFLEMKYNK